jgi:hypothetical protein
MGLGSHTEEDPRKGRKTDDEGQEEEDRIPVVEDGERPRLEVHPRGDGGGGGWGCLQQRHREKPAKPPQSPGQRRVLDLSTASPRDPPWLPSWGAKPPSVHVLLDARSCLSMTPVIVREAVAWARWGGGTPGHSPGPQTPSNASMGAPHPGSHGT